MLKKYYCLFTFCVCIFSFANGQYLCDKEYKVIKIQKKAIQKKATNIANVWILLNADSLNLPEDLKLNKISYLPLIKEEENKWEEIDSLMCIKGGKELITQAKKRLLELQLVVYQIQGYFNYKNTTNDKIKSVIIFEYAFDGKLIRTIIRQKEMSPYSEKSTH